MDIKKHHTTIFKKLFALMAFCVLAINNSNAQNLLSNGDFENGASGNGFQTQSPYNYLATLTGNSVPGDYAIISDAQLMNTAWFIHCKDHSGTGKMMVIDGITTGGQQRFWKAGNSGGGVGPLTVGTTYTFSYWVRSVSKSVTDIFTTADIGIQFNNASSVTLTAGSTLLPFDTATGWVQVKYTFVPTNAYVNIEMYNNNTSAVGNDFALDDIAVLAPPLPLAISYSLNNPTCYNNTDGYIIAYGIGGTAPYTYSFDGGTFSAINTLTGLATSSHTVTVKDALLNTVTSSTINTTAPLNPLTATASVNPICAGNNTTLTAANGGASYNWTANPVDASLTTLGVYNPIVSPANTTTYTVTSSTTSNVNLIYNGNFSLGNTGFTTDYTYKTINTGGAQRSYGVMPNAQIFFNTFSTCGDKSTGTENMYVVDGSLNTADKVWCQTVVVKPSTTYTFSYWIQTLTINNPAQIETKINGVTVPASTSANPVTAPATVVCGNWQQVSYTWTSGVGVTTAEICLYDKNVNANGNDFALDDISFTGSYGCNLSKTITVAVDPPASTNNINLFDCNSVTYKGNTYTNNTIVRDTIKAVQGCDSVYNVANITVNSIIATNKITNLTSCKSIIYKGNTYNISTVLKDTVKSFQGCDSIYNVVNINITPITTTTKTQTLSSCKSIVYNGNTYAASTILRDTVKSYQGCDSVYNTVNITINPLTPTTQTQTLTNCKSIVYNGNTYTASTILRDTVKSFQGCDSIYNIVNININSILATTKTQTLLSCKSIVHNGNTYAASTVLKDTVKSFQGCDSIYNIVNININPITPTTKNTSISGCDSVIYKTIIYKASTVLRDTVKSLQGCDSIYNVATITVKQATSSTTIINATSPYTWNGTTYTTSGTYIKTGLINSAGCDSTATLVLTIASIITNPCWKMISTGANHTVAIKADGTLWAWGQNTYGQVGDGTNTHRNIPTQIGTDTNWESISAKGFHTVAIKTNGTLWAWGQNNFGQVGDGTTINRNTPVQVGTATNWSSLSSGISFTLALKKDSTLWAWGYNILGQLGDGTLINKNTPIQIGTYNKWVSIGTGEYHSAAIKVDGTLWTWGSNSNGQLGDGTTVNKTTPTQIGTDNNWASFKGGNAHTIALKTDNTLWTWGGNLNGQLGDGTNISKNNPTQLGAANNWRAINAGGGFSMALTTTGTIWASGKNTNGQLGNGTTINNNTLAKIGVDTNWTGINGGDSHIVASKIDGSLWACGYNLYGQLGDGTNTDKNIPKLVISGCSPCPVATTQTQTLASCKAIVYNSFTYTVSTVLKDTIKAVGGCDSIYNIVNINISPITTTTNTDTASGCGSVVYKSITYTASTILKDTIKTLLGCDSIYNIATITVHPAITTPIASVTQQPTCNDPNGIIVITNPTGTNYVYSIDGVNYQSSANFNSLTPATYFVTVKDTNTNCISSSLKLVVDTVQNVSTPTGYVSVQPTCSNALGTFIISSPQGNNYGYYINGSALAYVDTIYPGFSSGVYSIVAIDLNTGCISDTLNLTLNPYIPITPTNNIINLVGCNSVIYKGTTYTTNAILKDTVKSFQGCDSIYNVVNININLITATINTQTFSSCKSIVFNSNTYSSSTVLKDTVKSYLGCDSVYNVVNININPITAITNNQTISSCNNIVYNGNTYATSTVLRDTVKSLQGCDSVYNIVNIKINPITAKTNTQTLSSCISIVYSGNTYSSSTVLKDTTKSLQGCDSIYNITNININPLTTTTNTQTISSCKSVVYNAITYSTSIVLKDTVKSVQGCDSIYNIVNITIKPIVAITKTSNFTGCGSVNYNSVLYTTSISYFDTTRSLQGCDSIYYTTNIIVYPLPTINVSSDLLVMPNSSVVLNPIITNATSVVFTPAKYLDDATSSNPICTPLSDQTYLIKATSMDGCTDTSSLKIFIVKPISVPNVFSPNGDGINDTWDIAHITDYPFATISIFNRNGQLLKSSKTKSIKVWDGTYNGQPVPVAAYYWIIKLTPNSEQMSGIVTVLR